MRHQCELLGLCRSSYYYQCAPETDENLALMRRLDELHLEHPVYGSRKLAVLIAPAGFGRQSQAGGAAAAFDGDRGDLRQAAGRACRNPVTKFIRICCAIWR